MDKNILLDRLTTAILESGFNKKFDKEDFIKIIKSAGFDIDNSSLELLQRWSKYLVRIRDLPLKTRQDFAIQDLVKSGIRKEDAIDVVNEISKMVVDVSKEKEEKNDVEQKNKIEMESRKAPGKPAIGKNLLIDEVIEDIEFSQKNQARYQTNPLTTLENKPIQLQTKPRVIQGITYTNQLSPYIETSKKQKNSKYYLKGVYIFLGLVLITVILIILGFIGIRYLILSELGNSHDSIIFTPQPLNSVDNIPTPQRLYDDNNRMLGYQKEMEIDATNTWHYTGFVVKPGQKVEISYISGTWASIANSLDYPFTYPGSSGIFLDVGYSAMIGKIGENPPFAIGKGVTLDTKGSGKLYLRINDDDDTDNSGTVFYKIEQYLNQ